MTQMEVRGELGRYRVLGDQRHLGKTLEVFMINANRQPITSDWRLHLSVFHRHCEPRSGEAISQSNKRLPWREKIRLATPASADRCGVTPNLLVTRYSSLINGLYLIRYDSGTGQFALCSEADVSPAD